ncbi:hypothetical protein BOX15_Mlig002005g1, partial [Macrostomum lignano]
QAASDSPAQASGGSCCERCAEVEQMLEEAREELEEFQTSSRELEAELETQLQASERREQEARSALERSHNELQRCRERSERQIASLNGQLNSLQDELNQVRQERDRLRGCVRELETLNDDLERAKRHTLASLEDFEQKLNAAIERNAFLESELDEKAALVEMVQRLKDESRDLREEVTVQVQTRQRISSTANQSSVAGSPPSNVATAAAQVAASNSQNHDRPQPHQQQQASDSTDSDANRTADRQRLDAVSQGDSDANSVGLQTEVGGGGGGGGGPTSLLLNNGQLSGISADRLNPNVRVCALNLVGDLLTKVGALESKLASCRSYYVRDHQLRAVGQSSQQHLASVVAASSAAASPPPPSSQSQAPAPPPRSLSIAARESVSP